VRDQGFQCTRHRPTSGHGEVPEGLPAQVVLCRLCGGGMWGAREQSSQSWRFRYDGSTVTAAQRGVVPRGLSRRAKFADKMHQCICGDLRLQRRSCIGRAVRRWPSPDELHEVAARGSSLRDALTATARGVHVKRTSGARVRLRVAETQLLVRRCLPKGDGSGGAGGDHIRYRDVAEPRSDC
jgi:hypothetical protein